MKRFTATEKWGKEWYQSLKPRLKCLWQFICDHADPCGAWEPNFGLATFQIGEKVAEADLSAFGDRVAKLPNGKYLIPSFVEFQYGTLSEACPAHKPVFKALDKNKVSLPYRYPIARVLDTLQEEEKEKEEEGAGRNQSPPEAAVPKPKKDRGDIDEIIAFCVSLDLPESDGAACFHKWEGNGWKNGQALIKDWKATIRSWKAAGYLPSQKRPGNPMRPSRNVNAANHNPC